jgi:hypothetical protein
MISIIHYISANKRLQEVEKTVTMLGGESECPVQILAQRDMLAFERDFYKEEYHDSIQTTVITLVVFFFILFIYFFIDQLIDMFK